MKTNGTDYFVFEMGIRDRQKPRRQVSRGPLPLGAAKQFARIGATEGKHDRAVTTNPRSRAFRVVAQYEARTGDNVTGEVYRGQKRRTKRNGRVSASEASYTPNASPEASVVDEPLPEPEQPAEVA